MAIPTETDTTINRQSSASTTLTFNMPTTRPAGDFFLALGFKDDDDAWTGIPTNWTEIFQEGAGTAARLGAWWFVGGASEPATYALTMDNEIATAIIIRIDGARLDVPINQFAATNGSGANQLAPAATPTVAETLVIRAIAVDRDDVIAAPAVQLSANGGGGANDVGDGSSKEDGPDADTTTGTAQFTHATDEFASATICIAPFIPFVSDDLSDVAFPEQNLFTGPFEI